MPPFRAMVAIDPLQESVNFLVQVKRACSERGLSPDVLARETGLHLDDLMRFFDGLSLEEHQVARLCEVLHLPAPPKRVSVVQQIRHHWESRIRAQCGWLKVMGHPDPLPLESLFVPPPVAVPRHPQAPVPVTEVLHGFPHWFVTGGVGTGKTTLLKFLTLACSSGLLLPHMVPLLIPLPEFANVGKSIKEYGAELFAQWDVPDRRVFESLLHQGRLLLLFDGLDHVPRSQRSHVTRMIQMLAVQYPKNYLVVASGTPDHGTSFEQMRELVLSDWTPEQASSYAERWFRHCERMELWEEWQRSYGGDRHWQELCTRPLLLAYACARFEQYRVGGTWLMEEAVPLLLCRWPDVGEGDGGEIVSSLAIATYDQPQQQWSWSALCRTLKVLLARHGSNLTPQAWLESYCSYGLLSRTASHAYRFTFSALQDGLAARKILDSSDPQALRRLCDRLHEPQWHSVILTAVTMISQPERMIRALLQRADQILADDLMAQSYLTWVQQQAYNLKTPYRSVALRAFYLDIDLERTRNLDRARALDIAHSRSLERAQMKALGLEDGMQTDVDIDHAINLALNLDLALYFARHPFLVLACAIEPELANNLAELRRKLPDPDRDRQEFSRWWQVKGLEWSKRLRAAMIQHRKSSQDWNFKDTQRQALTTYYQANILIVRAIRSCHQLPPDVAEELLESMLLPVIQPHARHDQRLQEASTVLPLNGDDGRSDSITFRASAMD